MANLLYQSLHPGMEEDLFAADAYAAAAVGLNSADDSLPYSTSELNAPEYATDEFRMFQFKVARCSKRYVHDWRACPFAHPTENARRRDPRLVKYLPVPCPDYKRGICLRGDACTYSHGVYECWLHPAKYRTQLCKEGPNCRRPVCFFAHSVLDLRQPSHVFNAAAAAQQQAEDGAAAAAAAQLQQQQAKAAAVAAAAASARLSTDTSYGRLSSEEVMNNMGQGQDGSSAADAAAVLAAAAAASPAANGATAAAMLLAGAGSPTSRQSSASLTRSYSETRTIGSAQHSPTRSASPPSPGQAMPSRPESAAPTPRSTDGLNAPLPPSDAAAAMAVLMQQQQAHAATAQAAAAAIARLSVDARGSVDAANAAAAAATTKAMLQAAGANGLPPRMSLDSLLATRQASGGWAPAPAPPSNTTAAAALAAGVSTLPLNEQPFPTGNAPRMSNAVARKLGLAPQRTSLDARLQKLRGAGGGGTPRSSYDGILTALHQHGSARSSLESQHAQAAALAHAMAGNPQLAAVAGLGGGGAPGGYPPHPAAGYGGVPQHNGYGMPHGGGDGMGLHPALLSLVAAQMAPHQQMAMPPHGVPNGMHSGLGSPHGGDASNMAALVDSLSGWQLGGGGTSALAHRASVDGVSPVHTPQSMQGGSPAYYQDGKAIWGSQEAINNQAGGEA